jgi:hypothetical protein
MERVEDAGDAGGRSRKGRVERANQKSLVVMDG